MILEVPLVISLLCPSIPKEAPPKPSLPNVCPSQRAQPACKHTKMLVQTDIRAS